MDNSKLIPPHLNAEVYRTDTTGTDSLAYLDYIRLHPDGSALIGCSELTGRYWNGGANILNSISQATQPSKRSINLVSGTAAGCFVQASSKVLLCDDNGTVSVWSNNKEDAWKDWHDEISVSEHDGGILTVDCLDPGQEYITAGADGNVKVWDVKEMICIRNYSSAHSLPINEVAVRPQSVSSFATCSVDQYVTLWDDNVAKAVIDIVKNDCGIRCLQWLDDSRIVYGDEAGILRVVDVRNTEATTKLMSFPEAIHRLTILNGSQRVAVCCDNKIVTVCDINEANETKVEYSDRHMHKDSVRGAAWDPKQKNILYTVGWDGEIKTHNIICD